jgi:hypothetical protein
MGKPLQTKTLAPPRIVARTTVSQRATSPANETREEGLLEEALRRISNADATLEAALNTAETIINHTWGGSDTPKPDQSEETASPVDAPLNWKIRGALQTLQTKSDQLNEAVAEINRRLGVNN